jgi:hypothetical protein
MQHINRRELLKTTGTGAGIALGAGAASGDDPVVTSSEPVSEQEVVSTFGAEAQSAEVAIDVDPSEFENNPDQVLQEINTGEPLVTITQGDISDDGTLTVDSTDIAVPDLIDVVLALDPKQSIIDIINGLDIYEDIINELDFETDIKQPLIDYINQLDFGDAQVAAIEQILGILNTELELGLPLDLLPIDTILQNPETGIPELLSAIVFLVDDIDSIETTEDLVIGIVGLINQLVIDDPANELEGPEDLLPFLADQISALDLSNLLSLINIEVSPDTIEGTVNPAEDPLLIEVPLQGPTLSISIDVQDGPDPVDIPFDQLSLTLTTGESGNLAGDFTGDTSTDPDSGTAVVVDNEFTANITDFDLLELVNKLDLEALVEALLNLLAIDPADYPEFTIPGFVDDLDLPSIVENADLLELLAGLITDESGRHAIRATLDMTFSDLQAVYDEVEVGPPPIDPENPDLGQPTDTDGDGVFEDVDGDGEFTIADVQTFFEYYSDDTVKENAEFFDFAGRGGNPSIFDVQALFNKYQEQS